MSVTALRSFAATAALALAAPLALLAPAPAQASTPTITTFACPLDNGGGRFYCFIDYTSATPASVTWSTYGTTSNEAGHSDHFGRCVIGEYLTVTVTVTNASGATSRTSRQFRCNGGPIIL
jgi:hypothetical protein